MGRRFYTFIFLFCNLLIFSYAGGNIDVASEHEEIKDTIVVHGMVLHGRVVSLGPENLLLDFFIVRG